MLELDVKCSECGGSGAMQSAEWEAWWSRPLTRPEEEPTGPEEVPCGVCDGRQRVPTDDGLDVLAFLARQGFTPGVIR